MGKTFNHLTMTQRIQIETLYKQGVPVKEIAKIIGVAKSTVYRELKRGYCEQKVISWVNWFGDKFYKLVGSYSADLANEKYLLNQTSHGPQLKLGNDFDFVNYIEKRVLEDKLSPCAVLGEIKRLGLFSTDISKTTLYRYIADGVFPNLKLSDCPCYRKKKKYKKTIKRAPSGTSIEQRPDEVSDRNTFGHWEMDCVVGKKQTKDVILVLSERLNRYEIIIKMPNRKAETVVNALNSLEKRFDSNFSRIFKTITVDNGVEFSDAKGLEKSIFGGNRTSMFYCHPYTSCERGTNERLNRDIRRHLPKGSDLSSYSEERIQIVEDWLNDYPREVLGFATPRELFQQQVSLL